MLLNKVDIYTCKFFTLNEEKKLKFCGGIFKEKTADDIKNVKELKKVIAYCFWIISKDDVPKVSKFTASCFLKSLTPKIAELEKLVRKSAIEEQDRLIKETEELSKTPGTKYA